MIFSRKPTKNYFIDSENVNDVWVANIVNDLKKQDHIYIFYSENSTHMKSDSVRRLMELGSDRVTWIRCYIGTNALDFQLVTVLGAVASDGKADDEFIIVSNDAGFDAVVQFWQDQGQDVSRLKMDTSAGRSKHQANRPARKPAKKFHSQRPDLKAVTRSDNPQSKPQPKQTQQQPAQASKQEPKAQPQPQPKPQPKAQNPKPQPKPQQPAPKAQPKPPQPKVQPKQQPKQTPVQPEKAATKAIVPAELSKKEQAVLKSLCRSISSRNIAHQHDALNALLGDEQGMRIYNFLKSSPKLQQEYADLLLDKADERAVNYVRLAFAISGTDESATRQIIEVYQKCRAEGLQGINLGLVRQFGQEQAQKYYPTLRRHYRIMEKIR